MKDLESWVQEYEKYRDCFQKKLKEIERREGLVFLHYQNSKQVVYCTKDLSNLKDLKANKIATLNKKSNVEWVLRNWDDLVDANVMMYFVNLDSKNNWVLKPTIHSKVTVQKQLKKSLLTLFETVKEA